MAQGTTALSKRVEQKQYTFESDPGHGWLGVPYSTLQFLNIAHKVSRYSYYGVGTCWLEEDCDAGLFMEAFKRFFGHEPNVHMAEPRNNEHIIRSLPNYPTTR